MTTKRIDVSGSGFTDDDSAPASNLSSMQRAIVTIQKMRAKIEALERTRTEAIAIIGMGCRIPGGADTPEAFFKLLDDEVDAITEVPPERWHIEPESATSEGDARALRWGSFLRDIDRFDAAFFGISPREAESLDPQHRLLLEVTWEALERAGQLPERIVGTKCGVFVGIWAPDYQLRVLTRDANDLDAYCFTGTILSTAAGRLSYTLGAQGPCMSIDTACSSSLTAIHLACQSLRSGESSMAIAGGVNLMLAPSTTKLLSKTQALSPDGRCKTFDARANGYVRGEGCGMLVLKRLSDAERDGDTILALIRGSAVNQDGRSTGLTAPNVLSQQALLRQALENARLGPADIGYLETHGTGTSLGDPIEVEAIKAVFGGPRERGATCVLGALKSNIGHLEAAAGVAGLIKVVLAMQNERIPGNLHFRSLNPRIDLRGTPLEIAQTPKEWSAGVRPRYAGVSSFGISGTNAHVIVEEPPRNLEESLFDDDASTSILPISAKTPEALRELVQAFHDMLISPKSPRLLDIIYTASARRSHYLHRFSAVGETKAELAGLLQSFLEGNAASGVAHGQAAPARAKVVFVFSGQGSQWLGMGRQFYESDSSFRSVIDTCDNLMTARLGWSILDELDSTEATSRMAETQAAQPLLFAVQIALVEMLRAWGIAPDAVIGHSVGEIAAAHIAGILSLDEAIRLVSIRGRIMQQATGMGKMVAVSTTVEEAKRIITGYEDRVAIAAINDPNSIVLSGVSSAIDEVLVRCEKQGFIARPLRVNYAFHSPQMDSFEQELTERLVRVDTRRATLAMYSTLLGDCVDGKELDVRYWGRNIRETVNLAGALFSAIRDGYQLFLEVGPHPVLTPNIQQCLSAKKCDGLATHTMRRNQDQRRTLLEAIGALYTRGCLQEWSRIVPGAGKCIPLPTYPWRRERYWITNVLGGGSASLRAAHLADTVTHPLLGSEFSLSGKPNIRAWQHILSLSAFPWLADHIVQNAIVFPGAGYVEMALAAAAGTSNQRPIVIENVAFERMLALPTDVTAQLQMILNLEDEQKHFHIATRNSNTSTWQVHARGQITQATHDPHREADKLAAIRERCKERISKQEHYARLDSYGLRYGAVFQGVEELWNGTNEVLARVNWSFEQNHAFHIHPAQLDAYFQIAGFLVASSSAGGSILPVAISRLSWNEETPASTWVHARKSLLKSGDYATDLDVFTENGELVLHVDGLAFRRIDNQPTTTDALANCVFELGWLKKPLAETISSAGLGGGWLILTDSGGFGKALATSLHERDEYCVIAMPGRQFARIEPTLYRFNPQNPNDLLRIVREAFDKTRPCVGAVHLLGLDSQPFDLSTAETLKTDELHVVGSAVSLAQTLTRLEMRNTPKLALITRAAYDVENRRSCVSPIHSALWGLGRTIALEHPDLECMCIDLEDAPPSEHIEQVVAMLLEPDGEVQVALTRNGRHVARLVASSFDAFAREEPVPRPIMQGQSFRLGTTQPGVLEHLHLFETTRKPLAAGMVEIEVEAAGLNFLDVLLAMGILPSPTTQTDRTNLQLGLECAGRIGAVGDGVTDVHVGQEVIALGFGTMASHVVTRQDLVVPKPETLEWENAAALPIVFLTAYHALAHVGHLGRGERVLIHAGAGGVGMAAIQWAKHVGAEIFATAGSESKRALLRSIGVHHALDSRSLSFVEDIQRLTNGEGIDVVLNSLSGEFIPASLGLLRDYGRFIEIGKRDYYEDQRIGLKPFLKNLSFTLVDLRGMMANRPDRVAQIMREVLEHFKAGTFTPLPCETFGVSRAAEAFAHMAQAKHTGKICISMRDAEALVVTQQRARGAMIRADGTYLLTGGLGGLGLSLAQWMVKQGARNLALVGRNPPSARAREAIAAMQAEGASVSTILGDISQVEDTRSILAQIQQLPPLRGVVHAAGVVDDHTLLELDASHLANVFAPKARGAWNLHEATKTLPLDFFVIYSSATGLVGSPGQANYAAANAFVDALAVARRRLGLPATSIQWGPFSTLGMAAARENRGSRLHSHGLDSLTPDEGALAFSRCLQGCPPVVAVMRFSVRRWLESYPQAASSPFWAELRKETVKVTASATNLRQEIAAMPPDQQLAKVAKFVIEQLGRVIRMDAARIDPSASFTSVGVDSLTSLELRNRLEASLGLKLPPTLLFTYANPTALAQHLLRQLAPTSSMQTHDERKSPEIGAEIAPKESAEPWEDDLLAEFDASIREVKTEILS